MSDTLHGQDVRLAFGCQRGRRPPATNSSGSSCWDCLQGREKKGRRGRADIAYYVFPSQLEKASAVLGWECWWISVVSGEHWRKCTPFPASVTGEPASPEHQQGWHSCLRASCLWWRPGSAPPPPVSFLPGKVAMESLGKDLGGACRRASQGVFLTAVGAFPLTLQCESSERWGTWQGTCFGTAALLEDPVNSCHWV